MTNKNKLHKEFFNAINNLKPIMNILKKVPIKECGEKMVNVRDLDKKIIIDIHKKSKELHNLKDNVCYLRKGVVEKLIQVQNLISEIRPNYRLKIFEGFRSHKVQQKMWDRAYKIFKKDFPNATHEELFIKASSMVAPVSFGVTPHSTGSAVDLTIVDENGKELNMGTKYIEFNEKTKMFNDGLTKKQKENRSLLRDNMEKVGFATYPLEWWHYCYGDRMHAIITKNDFAIYSNVKNFL